MRLILEVLDGWKREGETEREPDLEPPDDIKAGIDIRDTSRSQQRTKDNESESSDGGRAGISSAKDGSRSSDGSSNSRRTSNRRRRRSLEGFEMVICSSDCVVSESQRGRHDFQLPVDNT